MRHSAIGNTAANTYDTPDGTILFWQEPSIHCEPTLINAFETAIAAKLLDWVIHNY